MADKIYLCPMHPQVSKDEPGDCPICGMSLNEKSGLLFEQNDYDQSQLTELKFLKRRFLVCLLLLITLIILPMLTMSEPMCRPSVDQDQLNNQKLLELAQLLLATPIVFWGGSIFLKR